MNRHPLDGVRAKLARADEHLHVLQVEWQKFIRQDPSPYGFTCRAQVQASPETGGKFVKTGRWVVGVQVRDHPPLYLSAVAGDVTHNLRSALDHLAWQFVDMSGGSPTRRTAFPIYRDEREFIGAVEGRRRRDNRPGPLSGIDPRGEVWALIKRFQPYQRGDCAEALALLQDFSNADKHRELWAIAVYPEPETFSKLIHWNPAAVLLDEDYRFQPGDALEDAAVIADLQFDPDGPDAGVYLDGEFALNVAFSNGDDEAPRASLRKMHACVAQVVEEAAVHFR